MLEEEIATIHDEKYRKMLTKIVSDYHDKLKLAKATNSGKHHPPEERGEGGLLVHIRRMVRIATDDGSITKHFGLSDNEHDILVVAIILHDIGKVVGEPHQEESCRIFAKYIADFRIPRVDRQRIDSMILRHMGSWNNAPRVPETKLEILLSALDYIDSREFVHVEEKEANYRRYINKSLSCIKKIFQYKI